MPGDSHTVNEFIERLERCSTFDDLSKLFHAAYRSIGFTVSAYTRFHVHGFDRLPPRVFHERMVMTTTFPHEWQNRYNDRGYHRIDPVFHHCRLSHVPARWHDTMHNAALHDEQHQLFREARDAGLFDGFAIPIHGPKGELAVVGLASEASEREFAQLVKHARHTAHLMAVHFHGAVQRVLEQDIAETCVLTEREIECLSWTAQGKSSWDIAQILAVSERTVNFHMSNAMRKLDVTNRTHAVAKSISDGLISITN